MSYTITPSSPKQEVSNKIKVAFIAWWWIVCSDAADSTRWKNNSISLFLQLPNTNALAAGMRHAYRLCVQDLHMLYFRTAVYTETKQLVKPIDLNRLYENLGYLLYNYMARLVLRVQRPLRFYSRPVEFRGNRGILPPYPLSDNVRINT